MTKGIFITGTGTDVGKTIVTAGLMELLRSHGYNACYFKPALSGAIEENHMLIPGDTKFVSRVSGLKEKYEDITPYIYKTATAPHLASKIENKPICINLVKEKFEALKKKYDFIVVEGSGGIVCPLIDNENGIYLLQDLIKELNLTVIIVASAGLGTINHTVTTVAYIKNLGIKIKGIIVNGYEDTVLCNDNIKMIEKLTKVPILAIFPWIDGVDKEELKLKKFIDEVHNSLQVEDLINCMDEI
ncbi:ATP-dependent dethiobiotin synthetase BioD [Clostridium polyendosporum]|uniref:ATP-dependent dethiobiotin synthetase BioD n=1 Tax=Clostridium polyendosporum TaxID=69208 RepID=A0A919RYD4_9CLOT|nr:dethiobiotin synthase [Clostridium polyendosporum]GIM28001.1 ATP-dependent dethiobiotin synthetase BioD [Clostridium polyendosporum]